MTKTSVQTKKTALTVDLNCDLGEGIGDDPLIMPLISSANIACGYHAGNKATMQKTVELAIAHGVRIGAHPSFKDRENFGRTDMRLSLAEVYDLVTKQIRLLYDIARKQGASLHHVKPHGALYNMAARTKNLAATIALAVKDVDEGLVLYGSRAMLTEARKIGVKTCSEVFADRRYNDDGSLVSRKTAAALIDDDEQAVKQVLQMVKKGTVRTINKVDIAIPAETICIHGDRENAVSLVKAIRQSLKKEKIVVAAP